MKIRAITPMGTFVSVEQHLTDLQRHELTQMLTTKLKDLKYFNCDTEDGPVYFGSDVIQNSVFVLLD
jgi:hypothetical protein